MANALGNKQMKLLLADLARQGCTIREKTDGYWIGFPNGNSTMFHRTPSDHRALLNMRGEVRRNNVEWLFDPKKGGK